MPQMVVIGSADKLKGIPGAAFLIPRRTMEANLPVSGNELLRKVPGLHVVDEEGVGLRANIGIRGLDPDRSRTVLMLEDGVPIALAPYGEPEMYYTPAIDRMSAVEVIKGSGSILFGPQTFGGVINYYSENPPLEERLSMQIRSGGAGFLLGKITYGNTVGNTGFLVTLLQKQADRIGITHFNLTDLSAKFRLTLSEKTVMGVKLGVYSEESNATYVGLTQKMFESGAYDFTHPAPDDALHIRRYSGSVSHQYFFTNQIYLTTTAFAYTTDRNWSRQDFRTIPRANEVYPRVFGDPTVAGGALYFLDRTGNRNRQFEVVGVEPRLVAVFKTGLLSHTVTAGLRLLHEKAFEQRLNGTIARPLSGTLVDDEIRIGNAISFFVQDRLNFTPTFSVTPGIRVESFRYERDIYRLGGIQSNVKTSDQVQKIIPGIGLNYAWNTSTTLYAGIHRGFGPPRVKDAISSDGASENLDAELSWNSEAGIRFARDGGFQVDVTAFQLNFSNQIIPVSESSGGTANATGLTNGGETLHRGLEVAFSADMGKMLNQNYNLLVTLHSTVTQAEYVADRFIQSSSGLDNVKGNRLPYSPALTLGGTVNLRLDSGFEAGINVNYVSNQYGDERNTVAGSQDGLTGLIPAYLILDANAGYRLDKWQGMRVYTAVKNVTNERYIVSRRPQGIRLGIDRFVSVGVEVSF